MDLNIDPKDVLELAAQKLCDAVLEDFDDIQQAVESRIQAAIDSILTDEVRQSLTETIDKKLHEEVEKVLSDRIVPVDIWGEGKGEPTTIREQLHKRALEYWEERVEKDPMNYGRYRHSTYGGKPRHRLVFQDVAKEAFDKAMRENIVELTKAFRDAMRKDGYEMVNKHLADVINNRVVDAKR